MRSLTLVAEIPPRMSEIYMRKLLKIKNYIREEIGINVSLVVVATNEQPKLIVNDEIINLNESFTNIMKAITRGLANDLSDPNFLDRAVVGAKKEDE
ncbi:MAG: hypothetical protein LM561_02990 [Desulfurococcaceae archaeon]|nr:hypothetical protein [Desulfurococcaceae archaeon]